MSYSDFLTYSPIAAQAANQYNIPQSYLFGILQTESGWNPNAIGDNGAALGIAQLHLGAASDVGVTNRLNPTQSIFGAAAYLSKQYGRYGNWGDAISAYNQGHAGTQAGTNYANKVLHTAGNFLKGGIVGAIAGTKTANSLFKIGTNIGLAAATGGTSLMGAGGIPGIGGGSSGGGSSWVDDVKKWVSDTGFFERIALALVALILIFGAIYTLKGKQI